MLCPVHTFCSQVRGDLVKMIDQILDRNLTLPDDKKIEVKKKNKKIWAGDLIPRSPAHQTAQQPHSNRTATAQQQR